MAIKLTINIDKEVADAIAAAFDRKDRDVACEQFAAVAVRHFHAWLSGADRYRTLSEQYAAWIESLYDELLPPTEAPSVNRLYNSFNMPHGQATYIARVLSDKVLKKWRRQALKDLGEQIEAIWPTANAHLAKNEKLRLVVLRTSKLSALELIRLGDEAWREDKSFVAPTPKGGAGEQRAFELPAETVKIIRERIRSVK